MKKIYINKIALGTVQFGLNYGINNLTGQIPEDEVFKILTYASHHGINTLDTAYSYGESEKIIGKFFKINPHIKFNIVSKLPKSFENIHSVINDSLLRLRTKKIYAYLIHDFNFFLKNKNVLADLLRYKEKSIIGKIGFSLYFPSELEYLLTHKIDFDIIQVPYNIFDRRFEKYFEELKKRNVEIHVRSVFLQGLFFKKIDSLPDYFSQVKSKLIGLHSIADVNNIPLSGLCLNFVFLNPTIDQVVIGVDSLNNLIEDIDMIKYETSVKKIYNLISTFQEDDEKILIPSNWTQK